jgi:hypothetical protein
VPVRNLIDYLEHGSSLDEFLTDFPSVTREQAISVLEMAREAAGRRFYSTSQQTHKRPTGLDWTMEHPCHARDRRGRLPIRGLLRAQGAKEAPVPEEGMVHRCRRESDPMGAPGGPALSLLGAGLGTRSRYLRVVTLADKVTILNAFPDRGFKP